jgi:hypothetical protein
MTPTMSTPSATPHEDPLDAIVRMLKELYLLRTAAPTDLDLHYIRSHAKHRGIDVTGLTPLGIVNALLEKHDEWKNRCMSATIKLANAEEQRRKDAQDIEKLKEGRNKWKDMAETTEHILRNGGFKGNTLSELVAAVFADYNALLARCRRCRRSEWIPLAERMPTQEECSHYGGNKGPHVEFSDGTRVWIGRADFPPAATPTHWRRLNLPKGEYQKAVDEATSQPPPSENPLFRGGAANFTKFKQGDHVRVKPIGVEATGEVLEVLEIHGMNVHVGSIGAKHGPWYSAEELELAPAPRVSLGPEDVPPGSVFRRKDWLPGVHRSYCEINPTGVYWTMGLEHANNLTDWMELMMDWQIQRPGQDWHPCSKPAPARLHNMPRFNVGDTVRATKKFMRQDGKSTLGIGETARVSEVYRRSLDAPQIITLDIDGRLPMGDIVCFADVPLELVTSAQGNAATLQPQP